MENLKTLIRTNLAALCPSTEQKRPKIASECFWLLLLTLCTKMYLETSRDCVIFKNSAQPSTSAEFEKIKTITKIPFPVKISENSVKISRTEIVITSVIMGKRRPKNNFAKSTSKADTDDDLSEGEENLHRDLQRTGAAFIHPQRRQVWAPETPAQQNPVVTSSENAVVTESFDADDEQENCDLLPSTSNAQPGTSNTVRVFAGTIPIPTYPGWDYYCDSPESTPEYMRIGPGYPVTDFRPSYNRCESGRYLRFHGYSDETPDYIKSGDYYRDYPGDDPRDFAPAMLRDEPPSFLQATPRSSEEQLDESLAELNEALEREAPIDVPLSESQIMNQSQIFDQTTQSLDINYDSRENLDCSESGETFEEFNDKLTYLLECMKYLSTVNGKFREFFHSDDILDENWPRGLSPTEKIEQYEQCFSKVIEMDINEHWEFPDPNYFQRMIYRGPEVPRFFQSGKRIRRAPSIRPGSPTPGPSNVPDEPDPLQAQDPLQDPLQGQDEIDQANPTDPTETETDPEEEVEDEEAVFSLINASLANSETYEDERSLLIRFAYRAEILSCQLNNVLGRTNYAPPLIHDGDTNTFRGLNTRYEFLQDTMVTREMEIPALNRVHSSYITSRFLRALHQDGLEEQVAQVETGVAQNETEVEQAGQAEQACQDLNGHPIDLSNSQIDLNSNIQPSYPETSATSFNEDEEVEVDFIFTGNGSGTEQEDSPATNYREMAQNLISQQLASANVDSFALIYNDGTAHFQGSNSAYDLSSIEPVDGADTTTESNDENPEVDWPLRFEK